MKRVKAAREGRTCNRASSASSSTLHTDELLPSFTMSLVRQRVRAFRACVRRREISRGCATAVWRKNANDGRLCFSRENEGSRGVRACARACAFGRVLGRGSRGRIRAYRPLRWRGAGARWSGRSANFVGGPETTTRRAKIDGRGALEPKISAFAFFCDRSRCAVRQVQKRSPPFIFGGTSSRQPIKK